MSCLSLIRVRAVLVPLLFLVGAGASAGAREHARTGKQEPDLADLVARSSRDLLNPVLDSLKAHSRTDTKLTALLARVQLNTLSAPHPHTGPNAVAEEVKGQPSVVMDLVFLEEIGRVSGLAGLGITQTERANEVVRFVMREYEGRVAAAAKTGRLPRFDYVLSHLDEQQALRDVATRLTAEVMLSTVAWAVLHEIGHHVLGHLSASPSTLADSRQWEKDADTWAFRRMVDLGYHVYYLHWFFMAREALDDVVLQHGMIPTEAESSHPSYASRRQLLESLYDVERAAPVRMLAFIGVGWNENGTPQPIEAWLARYPDEDGHIAASIVSGSASSLNVFEWVDGEVHIYGRGASVATEIVIHDPDKIRSRVSIRYHNLRDNSKQQVEARWIQTNLAWARYLKIGDLAVYRALDNPLHTALREALRDAGVDAETSTIVIREWDSFFRTLRRTLIRYAREGEFAQEAGDVLGEFGDRMRKALGPANSEKVAAALLANPTLLLMMETFFKHKP